jgi:YD repeat-containing protein
VLSSFAYGYDNDNLQTSITEANGDVISFGYNAAHRLTSESRTGSNSYTKSYTLDGVGNRTSQTVGMTTTNFTLNSDDELTATSGGFINSYTYNANGEQTNRPLSGAEDILGGLVGSFGR